jgi:PhnB protein
MNKHAYVEPYLFFDGKCEEALEFYKRAAGAEVQMLLRNKEAPKEMQPDLAHGTGDKIMHASFHIGQTLVMASDGYCKGDPKFEGFALSLSFSTEAEVDKVFRALSEGGKVVMPLAKTFFTQKFGMVTDKFGVLWMVRTAAN